MAQTYNFGEIFAQAFLAAQERKFRETEASLARAHDYDILGAQQKYDREKTDTLFEQQTKRDKSQHERALDLLAEQAGYSMKELKARFTHDEDILGMQQDFAEEQAELDREISRRQVAVLEGRLGIERERWDAELQALIRQRQALAALSEVTAQAIEATPSGPSLTDPKNYKEGFWGRAAALYGIGAGSVMARPNTTFRNLEILMGNRAHVPPEGAERVQNTMQRAEALRGATAELIRQFPELYGTANNMLSGYSYPAHIYAQSMLSQSDKRPRDPLLMALQGRYVGDLMSLGGDIQLGQPYFRQNTGIAPTMTPEGIPMEDEY